MSLIFFFLGSALGAALRFLLSLKINRLFRFRFPAGTLAVNLIGCFLAGLILGKLGYDHIYLEAGFLASFTTFSTFILELENQITRDTWFHVFINVSISIFGGFFLFLLGRGL